MASTVAGDISAEGREEPEDLALEELLHPNEATYTFLTPSWEEGKGGGL